MTHEKFDIFLQSLVNKIKDVLVSKSCDYSSLDDKLYNFKAQARLLNTTPEEALLGNWSKHLQSILQGIAELPTGKLRVSQWWQEKIIDSINYQILLLALISERFGEEDE